MASGIHIIIPDCTVTVNMLMLRHTNINVVHSFVKRDSYVYIFVRDLPVFYKESMIIPNLFDVSADFRNHRMYSRNNDGVTTIFVI